MEDAENVQGEHNEPEIDKVALRREARRRKILENAKSRLERLGVSQNEIKHEQDQQYSDPEVEMEVPAHLLANQHQQQQTQPPQLQFNDIFDASLFANATGSAGSSKAAKTRSIYIRTRLHLFLIAAVSLMGCIFLGEAARDFSIFIPPGLFIIIELLFFREPKPQNPIINLVLSMCGLQTQQVNQFLNLFGIVQSLIMDLGILVFFYCACTCLLAFASEQFSNLIVVN